MAAKSVLWTALAPTKIENRFSTISADVQRETDAAWKSLPSEDQKRVNEILKCGEMMKILMFLSREYPKLYLVAVKVCSLVEGHISNSLPAPGTYSEKKKDPGVPLVYKEVDYDQILKELSL